MNNKLKKKYLLIILYINIVFIFNEFSFEGQINIIIHSEISKETQKFWLGGKYKITIKKLPDNREMKITFIKSSYNKVELFHRYLLMKSSGRECLTVYSKKLKAIKCFNIYDTPYIFFKENNPLKIETNSFMKLHLNLNNYPDFNIKYKSSHPEIINVNNKGIIKALRPGNAIISASGLDNKTTQIKVLSMSNNGFISNLTLNKLNVSQNKNVMIVAHPDDEVLWGGANLFKDSYFIVCLTNKYNKARSNDFREILKFTNSNGIILNYPDAENNVRDDWSEVRVGILKDLSIILNYKYWNKIVTYGPDGTTGHIHHKKTSSYVTVLAKKFNKFNNLYYFGKFYGKNRIPKNLSKITYKELEYKIKEVKIYKSVKHSIYKYWYHMLPYENWVLASKY